MGIRKVFAADQGNMCTVQRTNQYATLDISSRISPMPDYSSSLSLSASGDASPGAAAFKQQEVAGFLSSSLCAEISE